MLLAACTYIRIKFGIVWVRLGSDACFPFPISHGIVLILGNNRRCLGRKRHLLLLHCGGLRAIVESCVEVAVVGLDEVGVCV